MDVIKLDTKVLDRIARDLGTNTRSVIVALAFEVEANAKMLAPVDTGALRASGFTEINQTGKVVAIVGFYVEYAPFVELGTYKMGAQPFLIPALRGVAGRLNNSGTWREVFA